jgi:glutathione S-transferase
VLTLYQFEISPFCDKIRRVLAVKRQPFTVKEVPLTSLFGYRKVNPVGKVPALDHDGKVIADSTEIAHYLEAAFPDPPLVPAAPAERALCHVLEDWADESLYYYEMRLRFTVPHNARRFLPRLVAHEPAALRPLVRMMAPRAITKQAASQGVGKKPLAAVLTDVRRHVDAVGDLLGGRDFLVGSRLSLADISVFAQLDCIRGAVVGAEIVAAA